MYFVLAVPCLVASVGVSVEQAQHVVACVPPSLELRLI